MRRPFPFAIAASFTLLGAGESGIQLGGFYIGPIGFSTWSCINDINGDTTMVAGGRNSAGSWKVSDFPLALRHDPSHIFTLQHRSMISR
jgi:hypothetical protein